MKLLALTSKNLFNLFISIYMINSNICLHISCKGFYHKSCHFYSLCVKISTILTNKTAYRFWYLIYHLISHVFIWSPMNCIFKKKKHLYLICLLIQRWHLHLRQRPIILGQLWPNGHCFSLLWRFQPRKSQLQCKGMPF